MSLISRKAPEYDYLAQVVANTRREDAELLRQHGYLEAPAEASAGLLVALRNTGMRDQFDPLNVVVEAPWRPELRAAVDAVIGPTRVGRRYGSRRLVGTAERDVWRWILTVAGRDFGGLRLRRNPGGWCRIEPQK